MFHTCYGAQEDNFRHEIHLRRCQYKSVLCILTTKSATSQDQFVSWYCSPRMLRIETNAATKFSACYIVNVYLPFTSIIKCSPVYILCSTRLITVSPTRVVVVVITFLYWGCATARLKTFTMLCMIWQCTMHTNFSSFGSLLPMLLYFYT